MDEAKLQKLWNWIGEDLRLLARLHAYEVDSETLDLLHKSQFPKSLALSVDESYSDQAIIPVAQKSISEALTQEVSLDQLAADYAAIYLNVSYEASPNESAWIDEDNLERQEPMFEIRDWYTKYKLTIDNWRVRSDDNISLQLLFLSHLLTLPKIPLKDIGHFMDFHILRWVDDFAETIFQRAETGFYASLALLTARYLDEFRDVVAEVENKPRPSKAEVEKLSAKETVEPVFDPRFYSSHEGGW